MLFMSCKEAFEWKMNDDRHSWFSGNVASWCSFFKGMSD